MNSTLVYLQNDIENRARRSVLPFILLERFTCSALLIFYVDSYYFAGTERRIYQSEFCEIKIVINTQREDIITV